MTIVQDMAFASFLVSQGKKMTNIHRKSRKVSWEFDISEAELTSLEVSWPGSPECKFFNSYQNLKGHLKFSSQ